MKRNNRQTTGTDSTPTLFVLSTVAATKAIHPDEIDVMDEQFLPSNSRKQCQHERKNATSSGWICFECFHRWEDAGEDWAIARLKSLRKMKDGYIETKSTRVKAEHKRFDEAIADIDKEVEILEKLLFGSPVVLPLCRSDTTGEPTGERLYHWVEEYFKKGRLYLRYCYAPSRISPAKKLHIRGGESSSPEVQHRKMIIESAIDNGKSPPEIVAIIKEFI